MAVLGSGDRNAIYVGFLDEMASSRTTIAGMIKSDVLAAVNAVDAWIDANTASYNSALPTAARNGLTAKQKARLLVTVMMRRWEVT